MSVKYNGVLDNHTIGYFPFDEEDITKCYGTKADSFEVNPRSNILINVDDLQLDSDALSIYNQSLIDDPDGTLGIWKDQCEANPYYKRFVKFDNIKAITTSNVENNDYYDIKINDDLTTFTLEFFMNVLNFTPVTNDEISGDSSRLDRFLKIITEDTAIFLERNVVENLDNKYGLIVKMKNNEDEIKYIDTDHQHLFNNTTNFLNKNIHIPITIIYNKNKNELFIYADGELKYYTKFKEDIGKIKNIMFYTGWGTNYPWQHSYTNIIISDIVRYDLENSQAYNGSFEYTIPVSKNTYIPSYKIINNNYSTIKFSVVNTNIDNTTNRTINRQINWNYYLYRKITTKKDIDIAFDTEFKTSVDTFLELTSRKTIIKSVNLHTYFNRIVDHPFIIKRINFVF